MTTADKGVTMKTDDFGFLNSITKYPSIPTYHVMEAGRLTTALHPIADADADDMILTEKIDGTNARIIVDDRGDYLIGSRENVLYASGDRVGDPCMGIVDVVRPRAEEVAVLAKARGAPLTVVYGEVYGGKINGASIYTAMGLTRFGMFDVATFDDALLARLRCMGATERAAWREGGERPASFWDAWRETARSVPAVPILGPLPRTWAEAEAFLIAHCPETRADLDPEQTHRRPEGLVIRTGDRRLIAKMRFEDYAKALRGTRKDRP